MPRAVVLLSGGLDSCVAASIARDDGYDLYALSFDYGQRHARELESARAVARALKAKDHKVFRIDLAQFGGSALTDARLEVPTGREEAQMGQDIPVTYVPARNTVFLSIALAYGEVEEADALFIGANALDYSGYPDCRPEYFAAFERLASLATRRGVEGHPFHVKTPLLHMNKADIVRAGLRHHAPLHLTWSCYQGGREACGRCDSCILRLKGFREAGIPDPIPYATPG